LDFLLQVFDLELGGLDLGGGVGCLLLRVDQLFGQRLASG